MADVGLYLSGAGSLDGSDVFTAVLAYELLQEHGLDPVPTSRDIEQGEVINHRLACPDASSRNALDETARIVRGQVVDMRDVDRGELLGGVLVGGGGTLSTWTDFHERGEKCRLTERLRTHLWDLHRRQRPILCLDNSGFAVAHAFRERPDTPSINPGRDPTLREVMQQWGTEIVDEVPSWDTKNNIGCLPDCAQQSNLPLIREKMDRLFARAFG